MGIKNIIKESLLNEIGEASKTPFRFKRDKDVYGFSRKERDTFSYIFKTKEGYTYDVGIERVYGRNTWGDEPISKEDWRDELASLYRFDRKMYVNLRKLGVKRDDLLNVWSVGFSISDGPKTNETVSGVSYTYVSVDSEGKEEPVEDVYGYHPRVHLPYGMETDVEDDTTGDLKRSDSGKTFKLVPRSYVHQQTIGPSQYDEPNKGEFYRVMATIVKIVKNHLIKHNGKILTFTPYDERRGRVFSHFVLKQIPKSKVWVDDNTFYFLLNL